MRTAVLKVSSLLFGVGVIVGALVGHIGTRSLLPRAEAAAFNPDNLISNEAFQANSTMSVDDIQKFLARKGSGLANFSERGRSAAQIIYDAAHGYGEASGEFAGRNIVARINPQVILVTLQKEQSLVTEANPSQDKLDCAMGYGATDTLGCKRALEQHPSWKGFTSQVEFAAWQLQWNYERSSLSGYNDFKLGQQQTFADFNGNHTVTFSNAATASLYRYTPHVYNGNYNFFTFMQNFFFSYAAAWAGQSPYVTLDPEQSGRFWVRFKNTGTETWTKDVLRLGPSRPRDRIPGFTREDVVDKSPSGWITSNRVAMQEASVAPGEAGTFIFYMTPPSDAKAGIYREYFQIVADGIGWLEPDGIYWDVRVRDGNAGYTALWASQNDYPTLQRGQSYNFQVRFKNTGTQTWSKDGVFLATRNEADLSYIREDRQSGNPSGWVSSTRIGMQESSVAPGQYATFSFWMTVNPEKEIRSHREYFRMITKDGRWFNDENVYWDINIVQ